MHCKEAACIIACPTGAIYKDSEYGIVLINEQQCMGCFMCVMLCPFGAISVDLNKKLVIKCDFCKSRLNNKKVPACVEACPTKALKYGDINNLIKEKRVFSTTNVVIAMEKVKDIENYGGGYV